MLAHGLDSVDIAEIAWRPPSTCKRGGPMYLEVLVYKRNEDGHRHLDTTGEVATETLVVPMLHLPLTGLGPLERDSCGQGLDSSHGRLR